MADKKIVASFGLDGSQAKQELAALRQAEDDFAQSGVVLATDLSAGFEKIEDGASKAFAKLADGGKVSQSTFDALVAKLASLRQAIEDSGVPLEEMPEQFRTAFDKAQAQLAALAEGMNRQASASANIKEEFRKLAEAADDMGDETENAGRKIREAAERADVAFERFSKTMVENPKEALEQFPRLAGAVIQLRQEIERTQRSGGVVDPQDIARLRQFENQLETAKGEARSLKIEIDKASAGISDASQSWQGFSGVINDLAGRLGKTGVAAVGAWAALREGWQLGQQLNQVFGTDMSEWDKSVERFGAKANLYITRTFDSIMAGSQLLLAVLSGDVQQIKQAYAEAERAGEAFKQAQADIIEKWGADWDLAHPKVKKTTDAVNENTDAVRTNTEALKEQADAQVRAFEQATADRIKATTDKINEQIAAATGLNDATEDVAEATDDAATATVNAAGAADTHTAAIQAELDAVRALLEARGVHSAATKQQTQINLDAGASTDYLLMKERNLEEQLAASVTSWSAASEVTTAKADASAQLTAIVEREKAAQEGLSKATRDVTVSFENGQVVIKNTTDDAGKLVGVLENGKLVYTNLSDAQRSAEASGISFAKSMETIKQPATDAIAVMQQLNEQMAGFQDVASTIESTIERLNTRIRDMAKATREASGADDSAEDAA